MGDAPVYREMAAALASGKIFDLFRHNVRAAGHENMVFPLIGASQDVLPFFRPASFDLVFIDGDHAYSRAKADIEMAVSLVAPQGILCGDDLELQLDEVDADFAARERQRDYVPDSKTGDSYHPGVTLAVGEHFGRVSAWEGFWAIRKGRSGWEPLDLPMRKANGFAIPGHLAPVDDYRSFAERLGRAGRHHDAAAVLEHVLTLLPREAAPHLGSPDGSLAHPSHRSEATEHFPRPDGLRA
jgi:hypothetical protein